MADEQSSFELRQELEGRQIGRYLLQSRLASGDVATVYRAYDQVDSRLVALKVLSPSADPSAIARFRHEVLTAGGLKHGNIVRIYQVGTALEGDVAYMAMELVEGDSLADWLGRMGRLRPEEACNLLEPIARAMGFAHEAGVVHRDIKPSNILLRPTTPDTAGSVQLESADTRADYRVVPLLTDFGVARSLDMPELTHVGRTVGTPAYMAPEQCAGDRAIDGRADIYSLCVVLYRSVVGHLPFGGTTAQILHAHVYAPLTIDDEALRRLPPSIVDIMRVGLSKKTEDRYPDANALAEDLARAAGRRGAAASVAAVGARAPESTATMTLSTPAAVDSTSAQRSHSVLVPAGSGLSSNAPQDGATFNAGSPLPDSDRKQQASLGQRLEQFNWIGYGFGTLIVLALVIGGALAALNLPKLAERFQTAASLSDAGAAPATVSVQIALPATAESIAGGEPVLAMVAPSPTSTLAPQPAGDLGVNETMIADPATELTPENGPPPPTLQPTTTSLPTVTEAPSAPPPSPVPLEPPPRDPAEGVIFACTDVIEPAFLKYIGGMPDAGGPGFRCPNGAATRTVGRLLRFEYGFMMDLESAPFVYIFYDTTQEWERAVSSWREGDPNRTGDFEPPAPFLFQPEDTFGQLWADPQRQIALGFATTDQPASFSAVEQIFPAGALVGDENNGFIYLFLREKLRL